MKRQSAALMSLFAPLVVVVGLVGCWSRGPERAEPTDRDVQGVAIDTLPLAVVELPDDVRDGIAPAREIPVKDWVRIEDAPPRHTWEAALPVRPRATFVRRAPRGVFLVDADGRRLPWGRPELGRGWSVLDGRIRLSLPADAAPPQGYRLISAVSAAREARLNPAMSGLADPAAFVRMRAQLGDEVHTGLLLPAPAHLAVDADLPAAAELHLTPVLLPPEVADQAPSDGAELVVSIEIDGERTRVASYALTHLGEATPRVVDLSRWASRAVRIHLETTPGATTRGDYVFLADPIVAPRKREARRVVLVFIDTLRPDHTSAYGYERPTTPWLEGVAAEGARFTRARSIAPWTLPSFRSALTGRRPTHWSEATTLGETLRAAGFRTGLVGANLYLSDAFGGARGFGWHHVEHLSPATTQVDRAIAWLDAAPDRDGMLLVHLMDPHLPYEEPEAHRSRFAGPAPASWEHGDSFVRQQVSDPDPDSRAWIRDRYDNNVAWVDAELSRLEEHIHEDDLLVVFSDHGEEFWDHGGFEHGHTLHEELLRVPLVVRGKGITPAVLDAPVSVLDLAPTVLSWLDQPAPEGVLGRDLLPLLSEGTPPEPEPVGVGHVLYGFERWGVIDEAHRFELHRGDASLAALGEGLTESAAPLSGPARASWLDRLGAAHGRPVVHTLRVGLSVKRTLRDPLTLTLTSDGEGPVRAWLGEDASSAGTVELSTDGGTTTITLPRRWRGTRDVYLEGVDPAEAAVELTLARGGPARPLAVTLPAEPPEGQQALLELPFPDGITVRVGRSPTPRPAAEDAPISGFDPELREMLERAGYMRD